MEFGFQINSGYVLSCFFLIMLGTSAGLFDVPLSAYLQEKSEPAERGAILSANNFMLFSGMLIASLAFALFRLPTREGSEDFINQKYFGNVTATQKSEIKSIAEQFRKEWETYTPPAENLSNFSSSQATSQSVSSSSSPAANKKPTKIELFLENAKPELQQPLLAKLLWDEMKIRRARKLPVVLDTYSAKYAPSTVTLQLETEEQLKRNWQHRNRLRLIKDTYEQTANLPMLSSRQIFLLISLGSLPVLCFVVYHLAFVSFRFAIWPVMRLLYVLQVKNAEPLPENGIILIPDRWTRFDRLMIQLSSDRKMWWITSNSKSKHPFVISWLGEIDISDSADQQNRLGLEKANQALQRNEILLIPPDAKITTTAEGHVFDIDYKELIDQEGVSMIPVCFNGKSRRVISIQYKRPIPRSHCEFSNRSEP